MSVNDFRIGKIIVDILIFIIPIIIWALNDKK